MSPSCQVSIGAANLFGVGHGALLVGPPSAENRRPIEQGKVSLDVGSCLKISKSGSGVSKHFFLGVI